MSLNIYYHDPVDSYFLAHTVQTEHEIISDIIETIIIAPDMIHGLWFSNIRISTGREIISPNGTTAISIIFKAFGYIPIGYLV